MVKLRPILEVSLRSDIGLKNDKCFSYDFSLFFQFSIDILLSHDIMYSSGTCTISVPSSKFIEIKRPFYSLCLRQVLKHVLLRVLLFGQGKLEFQYISWYFQGR